MQVLAVINQKGGVGKTTTCANLGSALARLGRRVLMLDMDPQAHLSISFDRVPEPGEPSVYTLLAGAHRLAEVTRATAIPGLSIAPANLDLSGAETELANEIGRELLLKNALQSLNQDPAPPELVLLDCPPSLGLLSLNALVGAGHVILPIQAEFLALQGMAQLLEVLDRVKQRLNPRLTLLGIVVGMYSKQRNLSREVLQELYQHFGKLLFATMIRLNVRLAEAPSHGQTIFEYAPECGAAHDFLALAREVLLRLDGAGSRAGGAPEAALAPQEDGAG